MTHPGQMALTVINRGASVVAKRMVRWLSAALLVLSRTLLSARIRRRHVEAM